MGPNVIDLTSHIPIFPSARDFNHRDASAIVMDLSDSGGQNRKMLHRGGANVLYADWAAKFVPQGYIAAHLSEIETVDRNHPQGGAPNLRAYFNLWQELDRY